MSDLVYVSGYYTVDEHNGTVNKHISDGNYVVATKVDDNSANTLYYHQNHIGSTAMLTDSDGDVFQNLYYKPYGETWVVEGTPSDNITRLFTGQEYDAETGMYYYNARYYDPALAMFMCPDPAMQGANHYAYANCNPVMYNDPTGCAFGIDDLIITLVCMAIALTIGLIVTGINASVGNVNKGGADPGITGGGSISLGNGNNSGSGSGSGYSGTPNHDAGAASRASGQNDNNESNIFNLTNVIVTDSLFWMNTSVTDGLLCSKDLSYDQIRQMSREERLKYFEELQGEKQVLDIAGKGFQFLENAGIALYLVSMGGLIAMTCWPALFGGGGTAYAGAKTGTVWDNIIPTAENLINTKIPATFQVKLGDKLLWANANATEHMGEYIARFGGENFSTGIRSQSMLNSFYSSVGEAMGKWGALPSGRYFGTFGSWELGINTETGVIYHALMK